MSQMQIDNEITQKVEWLRDHNGDHFSKDWLIQAVLNDHQEIYGADKTLASYALGVVVRQRVEAWFRNAGKVQDDDQLVLPGYSHVREYYIVSTGDKSIGISVHKMSDEQIWAKITEMQKMRAGLKAHIKELIKYMEKRKSNALLGT